MSLPGSYSERVSGSWAALFGFMDEADVVVMCIKSILSPLSSLTKVVQTVQIVEKL